MFKKMFVLASVILFASLPVYAVKQKQQERLKVIITDEYNAVMYKIKPERSLTTIAYLANLDCNEYTLQRTYRTMNGIRYIVPVDIFKFSNTEPRTYVKELLSQYDGEIYYKPLGIGHNGYYVGEMYLGDESLNKHLVEKGYCTYIK